MTTREQYIGTIQQNIETLVTRGEVFEIKALNSKTNRGQHHGYYTDPLQAAIDAHDYNTNGLYNLYIGLNPRSPELAVTNSMTKSMKGCERNTPEYDACDTDVTRLCWLLIDIDPVDKKHGATPAQLQAAISITKLTKRWFLKHGCVAPHEGASGNGFHLLYQIDLPIERADDVHRLLLYLNSTFGTDQVKIDEVVFNPVRVTRLYGTINHKCPTPRVTALRAQPEPPLLTEEQLDTLLKECPTVSEQEAFKQGKVMGISEALDLADARAAEEDRADPLSITPEVEEGLVLWVIRSAYDPQAPGYEYFSVILPYLKPDLFNDDFNSRVFTCFTEYTAKYDSVPTTSVLRSCLRESIATDNPQQEIEYLERFDKFIYKTSELSTLDWFRDQLNPALENRAAKVAYKRMLGAVQAGEFAAAEKIWAERWKATDINDNYFGFIHLKDLLRKKIKYEWLVEGIFALGLPTAIGGLLKCLKTGCICDLVVSIATGTPFLGKYPVPKPRKVAFFSAESAELEIRARFAAICATRPEEESGFVDISFCKVKLSNEEELARIEAYCLKNKIEVCVVDPLYLTLLTGSDTDPSSVFAMGNILAGIGNLAEKGITPILCHHFRKGCKEDSLLLSNFAFTGLGEWARQSFLIGRTQSWTTTTNNHMIFSYHGFSRGGCYNLHVDEGEVSTDEEGKIIKVTPWKTLVQSVGKTHHDKAEAIEVRNEDKIMNFLQLEASENRTKWFSKNSIIKATGINNTKLITRIEALRNVGKIEVSDDTPPKYRMALDYHPPKPDDPADAGLDETFEE